MLTFAFLSLTVFLGLVAANPVPQDAGAEALVPSGTSNWPPFFTGTTLHPYNKKGRVMRHKCLDVAGRNYADGTKVQIWDCNGTPAQQWDIAWGSPNKIWAHNAPGLGFCLDTGTPTPGNGNKLVIKSCGRYEEHHDTQFWFFGKNGKGVQFAGGGAGNQCLDTTDGGFWSGNQMQTWECHDSNHPDYFNQQFFPGAMLR